MFRESVRFIKKTSFKKLVNAGFLYISYCLHFLTKSTRRYAFPLSISVEPAPVCNLACPECPTGTGNLNRSGTYMDLPLFKKIIDELGPYLLNLNLYFQGEPFLSKTLFEMIAYAAKRKKVYTVTSTNGHFLSKENCEKLVRSGLDKIIVALDGTTPEVYESYRKGGSFDTVIKGLKQFIETRKQLGSKYPVIALQFIVFKFNQHQIDDVKRLAKELKVDALEFKSAQVYNFENDTFYIPTIEKYARYRKMPGGHHEIKNKLSNRCLRLYESSVITNSGEVLPCCFDKNADHAFGNISGYSFKSINNNAKALHFRKQLRNNRKGIAICRNCTSGLYR